MYLPQQGAAGTGAGARVVWYLPQWGAAGTGAGARVVWYLPQQGAAGAGASVVWYLPQRCCWGWGWGQGGLVPPTAGCCRGWAGARVVWDCNNYLSQNLVPIASLSTVNLTLEIKLTSK